MFYGMLICLLAAFVSGILGFGYLSGDLALVVRFLCSAFLVLGFVCMSCLGLGKSS